MKDLSVNPLKEVKYHPSDEMWQYKESSKRSKRNHRDYEMNFSRLEYKLLMTAIIGCIACAVLGLFGSVFCVVKMF